MKIQSRKFFVWVGGALVLGAGIVACVGAIRAAANSAVADERFVESFKLNGDLIECDGDALVTTGVRTFAVQARDVPVALTLTGRTGLDMEHVAHVHAQFGGKVKQVGPQLGDQVKGPEAPGGPTVLCVIESSDLAQAKSNYLQAKVQLKLDEENLTRTGELVKSTVLADKFLLDAQSAVAKSRAALEATRQQLLVFGLSQTEIDDVATQQGRQRMDYIITAPRSGVIAEKAVSGGEVADPTVNLFTIADTSTMWVWGDVYERDLRRIEVGQPVQIVVTAEPDRRRHAKIDWISPVLDPNTHSIRIRCTLDNQDGHLLADMYGNMVVRLDPGKDSIVIPAECVVRKGGGSYVFVQVQTRGNKAVFRRTKVTVAPLDVGFGVSEPAVAAATADGSIRRDGTENALTRPVRILDGLHPGQTIVQSGALGLFNEMEQQSKQ